MLKCFLRYRMADKKIKGIKSLMEITGVSRNTINKLYRETDIETIKIGTLMQICDALQCNLSDLIEYKPD